MTAPTVLVVEDERDLADLYATWLADDYDVRTAYTVEEARETVDDAVDVALLDRRLPDGSGGDVLEYIRDQDLPCRVAMVTAVDPDFDIIELGFDDYVIKPVSEADLRAVVETLLDRRSYEEGVQEYLSLVSKQALLEAEKTPAELEANDRYASLLEDIEVAERELDEVVREFDTEDFRAAFMALDEDRPGPDTDVDF
ncbi:MAG: HalX domain-containing protein [Halobacteriaceae archaeon]